MKLGKRCTLALFLLLFTFHYSLFTVLHAQQPQTYVLQTGSGAAPTASAYPNLNLAPGSVVCNNAIVSYAGGTLTQLVNGRNFIFSTVKAAFRNPARIPSRKAGYRWQS